MNKYRFILLCVLILSISYVECKGGRGGGGGGRGGGGRGGRGGGRGSRGGKSGRSGSISSKGSITAGLTGSAIGFHLGHRIGQMNRVHSSGGSMHQYAVTHHYHKDRTVSKSAIEAVIDTVACTNITFCPPNSYPLCMSNGTIYCIASMNEVFNCELNATSFSCINTTLSAPCLNNQGSECKDSTTVKSETAQLPCISKLFVIGNFTQATIDVPTRVFQYKGTDVEQYCIVVMADPVVEDDDDDTHTKVIVVFIVLSLIAFCFIYSSRQQQKMMKKKEAATNERIPL